MTSVSSVSPCRPGVRRVALVAGLLVLAVSLPAAAVSPTPSATAEASPSVASPTAAAPTDAAPLTPTPNPTLTFAPLVTLPPIAIPAARDTAALEHGYALGAPDAPVTIEVWEDFQCPYCLRWTIQIEPQVIEAFVKTGQARLVYRPLAFLGEESRWAAVAADIAAEQDRFWPLHDLFFNNQLGENVGSFGLDRILVMAQAAGLDMDALTAGLQLDAARARYAALEEAWRADAAVLGISATPSVVIDGALLESPDFASIAAAVGAALDAAATPSATPASSSAP